MANRTLPSDESTKARVLLAEILEKLDSLAADDPLLLFAYRRKIVKELGYVERSKPTVPAKLKSLKWKSQNGICAHCHRAMPKAYSELDRKDAVDGYTVENTELVHAKCHQERQRAKRYS